MGTEEKARAYDEVRKKIALRFGSDVAEKIFSEFEMSEDEKVRKELINVFSNREKYLIDKSFGDITVSEVLAWLEKQCYTKKDVDDAYLKGVSNTKHELEKQGEQKFEMKTAEESLGIDSGTWNKIVDECVYGEKPVDKVVPKFKVKYAGSEYNVLEIKEIAGVTYYGIEDEPNHIDYVKAENCEIISGYAIKEDGSSYPTKPVVFSEQKSQRMVSAEAKEALYDKPTDEEMKELLRTEYEKGRADTIAEMEKDWSEEDDVMINKLLAVVKLYYDRSGDDLDKQSCISFLKSLKDKVQPQPKQEWSEEDKIARKALINLVEIYYGGCIDKTEKNRLLNLLKSLKPQNRWKPSDEQMITLRHVISGCSYDIDPLVELETKLKEL